MDNKTKKCFITGFIVIVLGVLISIVGYGMSGWDKTIFYEDGNHAWYKTIRIGEDFLIGIGE